MRLQVEYQEEQDQKQLFHVIPAAIRLFPNWSILAVNSNILWQRGYGATTKGEPASSLFELLHKQWGSFLLVDVQLVGDGRSGSQEE